MNSKRSTQKAMSIILAVILLLGGMISVNVYAEEESPDQALSEAYLSRTVITKGESVTVYAAKSTDNETLYAFYYKKKTSENWSTARGYSTAASVSITPAAATYYDIRIKQKDKNGTVRSRDFVLKVNAELENTGTVSKAIVTTGSSVTLFGSAKGGSEIYSFAYYFQRPDESTWITIKQYSEDTSVNFKPTSVGEYQLLIKVKDSLGKIAKKTFSLEVVSPLANDSYINASSIEIGKNVIIYAKASGGAGGYTYSYSFKSGASQSWTLIRTYSTIETIVYPVNISGKVTFLVKVKDSEGSIASKTMTVNVSDNSLDAKADAVLGQIITPDMNELEKVKAIHDWLVYNVEYDIAGVRSGSIPATSFTAEGLFDTHIAVCDGYSKAFLALAERAGLEAIRVTGSGTNSSGISQSHAWNQVKIEGNWYNIDVTWDDPIVSADYGDNLSYFYFLVPDTEFYTDHTAASAKNTCTEPQPVEIIKAAAYEADSQSFENFELCENENEFINIFESLSITGSAEYTFALRTDKSDSELFPFIIQHRPSGYYGISFSVKNWKLRGYKEMTIRFTK